MRTRYVSYDIADGEYEGIYEVIEEYGAEFVTESTYRFECNDELKDFMKKLQDATKKGDRVAVIYLSKDKIVHQYVPERNPPRK